MNSKFSTLITVLLIAFTFLTCSGDDGGEETPTGQFTTGNLALSDIENQGNGSDIKLSYTITSDLSILKEIRLLFSRSALSWDEATQVAAGGYKTVSLSASSALDFDTSLSDTDGNPVTEDVTYQVYLLGVFQNTEIPSILSTATPFTLKNETLVTTMDLTGGFNAMEDVVIASDGTIYANGGGTSPNNLYKVTPDGVSSTLSTNLSQAVGIAIGPDGNIYSSNFNSTSISKTTPAGVTTTFVTDSRLTGGGGLVFDNDGNLFNAFFSQDVLYQIKDGTVTEFVGNSLFNGPVGITYDKGRDQLYVTSFNSGSIYSVATNGTVTLIGDTPASIGHVSFANDRFYLSGWNQHKVYVVSMSGELLETIGRGTNADLDGPASSAQFSQPNGIEATPDGRYVYVTQGNGKLRRLIMARDN